MSLRRPSKVSQMEQQPVVIPDFTTKELLSVIPAHCFEISTMRSLSYVVMDLVIIVGLCRITQVLDGVLTPRYISLPHPIFYSAARFMAWAIYTFVAGLFGLGLWGIGHECGHWAFSQYKIVNDIVGFTLHSALGVPFFAFRFSHARHHAATSHMSRDEVYVPYTRSELGLPPFDPTKEDRVGARVADEVQRELWEAVGDSPIVVMSECFIYLLAGWLAYMLCNASGQKRYPKGTSHFNPSSVIFRSKHRTQLIISNVGVLLWLGAVVLSIKRWGLFEVFRVYLVPYIWVNHWVVLITFLQHTDPLIPHYRESEFTFMRGALATVNRNLLGDWGHLMGWFGAFATHGGSEIHVLHHVSSRIPHYHAWEATAALTKHLDKYGINVQGRPGGWAEMYRVLKECRFVEDEGGIVFFKNARGFAAARPAVADDTARSSAVDVVGEDSDD